MTSGYTVVKSRRRLAFVLCGRRTTSYNPGVNSRRLFAALFISAAACLAGTARAGVAPIKTEAIRAPAGGAAAASPITLVAPGASGSLQTLKVVPPLAAAPSAALLRLPAPASNPVIDRPAHGSPLRDVHAITEDRALPAHLATLDLPDAAVPARPVAPSAGAGPGASATTAAAAAAVEAAAAAVVNPEKMFDGERRYTGDLLSRNMTVKTGAAALRSVGIRIRGGGLRNDSVTRRGPKLEVIFRHSLHSGRVLAKFDTTGRRVEGLSVLYDNWDPFPGEREDHIYYVNAMLTRIGFVTVEGNSGNRHEISAEWSSVSDHPVRSARDALVLVIQALHDGESLDEMLSLRAQRATGSPDHSMIDQWVEIFVRKGHLPFFVPHDPGGTFRRWQAYKEAHPLALKSVRALVPIELKSVRATTLVPRESSFWQNFFKIMIIAIFIRFLYHLIQ